MKGLLTINAIYNWTPMEAPSGEGGRIPFADQSARTLTLANLDVNRIETTTRTATLDMNYGLTDRLGIQVAIPYKHVESDAQIGGLIRCHTVREDSVIFVQPSNTTCCRHSAAWWSRRRGRFSNRSYEGLARKHLAESTLQIGRGKFGIVPMIYQTYEDSPSGK